MNDITPKMEQPPQPPPSLQVPLPSRQTLKKASAGAIILALLGLGTIYTSSRYANRERTVTWINGETQTNWRPTTIDFRNTQFVIGITEDGFMVARPIKSPPPLPEIRTIKPEIVPSSTNK